MSENELDTGRTTITKNTKRINELVSWFRFEYPERLMKINRYAYLGLNLPETRYALEVEAYDKENELRELRGEAKLPPMKITNIL